MATYGRWSVHCNRFTICIHMHHVPGSTYTSVVNLLSQSAYILEDPVLKVIGRWCSLLDFDDSLDLNFPGIS